MLGTKWPSMTSIWMKSAPASLTASTSSPNRAKSADRIDGAMRISLALRFVMRGDYVRDSAHADKDIRKFPHSVAVGRNSERPRAPYLKLTATLPPAELAARRLTCPPPFLHSGR